MPIPTTKQSAFQAMEAFLTATNAADTLRVSESGRVYRATAVVVLFERARSASLKLFGGNVQTVDWVAKARQAVLDTLKRDVEWVRGSASPADPSRLNNLLTGVITRKGGTLPENWRRHLSSEIATLHATSGTKTLASALEKLEFFSRPFNAPLLHHLRLHMKGGASLSESLKAGLPSYLANSLNLSAEKAKNSSENIFWAMTNFDCDFKEALDIACCAGNMVNREQCKNRHDPAMLLALLRVRHKASLDQATSVLKEFKEADVIKPAGKLILEEKKALATQLAACRDEIDLMLGFGISFDQAVDISTLRKQHELSLEEAMLASLSTWPLADTGPRHHGGWTIKPKEYVKTMVDERIAPALPKGWQGEWQALRDGQGDWQVLRDGSRRLVAVDAFKAEYDKYLKDSFKEGIVDTKLGLASTFINDAKRTHFRFGSDSKVTKADNDRKMAIKGLTQLVPEAKIRESLSRCLFQGGLNGLVFSMGMALRTTNDKLFDILNLDPATHSGPAVTSEISIQRMENKKIRVEYLIYMKHISLGSPEGGSRLKINSLYNSSTAASATDHTAVAKGLVEFDMERLQRGFIEPQFVSDPELRLTIEPDRQRIMQSMINDLLDKQRADKHNASQARQRVQ